MGLIEKNELIIPVAAAVILITPSCHPSKTIADTCCPEYKSELFQRHDIANGGLAVMPEIGPNNNEIISSPLRDEIAILLKEEFDDEIVISTNQVISKINEGSLTGEYIGFVEELHSAGTVQGDTLALIGIDLGVEYLMFLQILPDSYQYHDNRIELRKLFVQAQIISISSGVIVWEGKGGSATYNEPGINITKETAQGLVQIIGNEAGNGPCESTDDIIGSVKYARGKSTIGAIFVALLLTPVLIMYLTWKVV